MVSNLVCVYDEQLSLQLASSECESISERACLLVSHWQSAASSVCLCPIATFIVLLYAEATVHSGVMCEDTLAAVVWCSDECYASAICKGHVDLGVCCYEFHGCYASVARMLELHPSSVPVSCPSLCLPGFIGCCNTVLCECLVPGHIVLWIVSDCTVGGCLAWSAALWSA
jgi:hypothetical protein